MQATVYNLAGDEIEKVELDDTIFGVTPNIAVIQQAVLRQQANARQGTHETLTRADVRGGGRKPWRQKGTGRARQGSTRSPQWAHGGVVFGPHQRSYEQDMPRKMRRLAIRGVLSSKASEGKLVILDSFASIEPRTKAMTVALGKLNVGDNSALVMLPENDTNLAKAAGNLPRIKMMLASHLSVVDMLKYDYLVMPRASIDTIQGILGNGGGRRKLTLRGSTSNGHSIAETSTPTDSATETLPPMLTSEPAIVEVNPITANGGEVIERIVFAPTAQVAQAAEATFSDDTEAIEAALLDDTETSEAATPKTTRAKNPKSKIQNPKSEDGGEK